VAAGIAATLLLPYNGQAIDTTFGHLQLEVFRGVHMMKLLTIWRVRGVLSGACRVIIGAAFVAMAVFPAHAATRVEKTFGSWAVVCLEPDKGGKTCTMLQSEVAPIPQTNKRRLVLRWTISIKDREQTQALAVPTGISTKEGVRLFLGEAEPIVIPYTFCGPRLCLASAPFDAKAAAAIKATSKASASYVRGTKKLVQVPLKLDGFEEAYNYIVKQTS